MAGMGCDRDLGPVKLKVFTIYPFTKKKKKLLTPYLNVFWWVFLLLGTEDICRFGSLRVQLSQDGIVSDGELCPL